MTILPENFSMRGYGLSARLVNEEDAPFIVSLRSDKERTKFMVTLDDDVEKQKLWIRDYKIRERKGEDYYFIYSDPSSDVPISVARISKINFLERNGKVSGWIKKRGPRFEAIQVFMLHRKIIFEVLQLSEFYSEIHKNNKASLSFFKEFDGNFSYEEKGDFLHIMTSTEDHLNAKKIFKQKYLLDS